MKSWQSPWSCRPSQPERQRRRVVYGSRWDRLSLTIRANHPLCQHCNKAPSTSVHHLQPAEVAPERMYDPSNLLAVCWPCHQKLDHPGSQ